MVAQREQPTHFIDHYYTLGIDTDANGDVVEDTYWRIIREWRANRVDLSSSDVDDLNDAYRVLTTPALRRAYDAERAQVLGPNAKPQPPRKIDGGEQPLRVMEKQLASIQPESPEEEPDTSQESQGLPALRLIPLVASFAGIGAMISLAVVRLIL